MSKLTFAEQVKIILKRKSMTIKALAETIEKETGKKMSRQNLTQRLGRDNFQEQDMRMISRILGCEFTLDILAESGLAAATEKTVLAINVEEKIDEHERDITVGELVDIHKELDKLAAEPAEAAPEAERVSAQPAEGSAEAQEQPARSAEPLPDPAEQFPELAAAQAEPVGTPPEPEEEVLEMTQAEIEKVLQESAAPALSRRQTAAEPEATARSEAAEPEAPAAAADRPHKREGGLFGYLSRFRKKQKGEPTVKGATELSAAAESEPAGSEAARTETEAAAAAVPAEAAEPAANGNGRSHVEFDDEYMAQVVEKHPSAAAEPDINPYTNKEYESNSVRVHPSRIGYVQVYDRESHQWTDMTEWAFLGYQERKKVLLGEEYEPPIYLD